MVRRSDDDHMARKFVDLKEERADDTLHLAGIVPITTLFADRVKFIQEEDARLPINKTEYFVQPLGGFSEVAANQSIIAHAVERIEKSIGDRMRERGLSVSRFPH